MNKLILVQLVFLLLSPFTLIAQQENKSDSIHFETYNEWLNKETDWLETQRVNSICGVNFGTPCNLAKPKLENKFGKKSNITKNKLCLSFDNIYYAGIRFSNVRFQFVSNGNTNFLNSCAFGIEAIDRNMAISYFNQIKERLASKYEIRELIEHNYISTACCGISPLWDGDYITFLENEPAFFPAIRLTVQEIEKEYRQIMGCNYYVILMYGPFEYVKEEF